MGGRSGCGARLPGLRRLPSAQLAVSANDAKVKLVNGKIEVCKDPPADTISFIDLRASPPKVVAEIEVPTSVVGPPSNVAVSPKEEIVLVAGAMQIDPAEPDKTIPDDKLTVIDISPLKPGILKRLGISKGPPPAPKVIATLQAGKGAAGVCHQQGRHARAGRQPRRGHGFRLQPSPAPR